jgi:hypothetical protein
LTSMVIPNLNANAFPPVPPGVLAPPSYPTRPTTTSSDS